MTSKNHSPSVFFILAAVAIVMMAFFFQNSITTIERRINTPILSEPLPPFSLPALLDSTKWATHQSLSGQVFLLNFWASWCEACQAEHATLLTIAHIYHVPIYGIAYKDKEQAAKDWLQTAGNPFTISAADLTGNLGDKFQLYGTPETFLIDKHGIIRYRYIGALNRNDWETILWPLVKQYEKDENQ